MFTLSFVGSVSVYFIINLEVRWSFDSTESLLSIMYVCLLHLNVWVCLCHARVLEIVRTWSKSFWSISSCFKGVFGLFYHGIKHKSNRLFCTEKLSYLLFSCSWSRKAGNLRSRNFTGAFQIGLSRTHWQSSSLTTHSRGESQTITCLWFDWLSWLVRIYLYLRFFDWPFIKTHLGNAPIMITYLIVTLWSYRDRIIVIEQ